MGVGGLNYIQVQGVRQPLIAPSKYREKLLLSFYNFCLKTSQSLENPKIGDWMMFTVSNVYFHLAQTTSEVDEVQKYRYVSK